LIKEKFLDEERFARSYARGKFYNKKWGRVRIINELKSRMISDYCIRKAMAEIDEAIYVENLKEIFHSKKAQYPDLSNFDQNKKAMQYCISRGFESELVYMILTQQKTD